MKILNARYVTKKLKDLEKKAGGHVEVVTGFTQRYAIHVHENLEAKHKEGKTAKYLERPYRENSKAIQDLIAREYERTRKLRLAVVTGGLKIQRLAQQVVPIDTAALKSSAYTAEGNKINSVATAAFQKSESVRRRQLTKRSKRK